MNANVRDKPMQLGQRVPTPHDFREFSREPGRCQQLPGQGVERQLAMVSHGTNDSRFQLRSRSSRKFGCPANLLQCHA